MIKQVHVGECDSTQDVLKEQLISSPHETVLVSCDHQIAGRGRGENKWLSLPGTLCFSMNVAPHPIMSFTAIELSVLVAKFFENKQAVLKLKWPNDVWDRNGKKCGGILVQGTQNQLLAGIGLNLFHGKEFGEIFPEEFPFNKKELALELAVYIKNNRYQDSAGLEKDWLLRCGHLNQIVRVSEGTEVTEGMFQGLGQYGEALVCQDGQIKHLYNGTLRLV